ncbi:fatty-acid--CoA ligase [Campylobacter sp. faydin G-140]|uniref:fatty-acid--CoA ligase n=1 Tax=Campylobacter anatolicus TaxID=2829105 RepID=UPI001B9138FC|nr:fatty-acid--CoA ligase [Campylobacter anatolicus]MBR8465762.1 fatty-acid--CoA ligase [Campylobacter anatolicus]
MISSKIIVVFIIVVLLVAIAILLFALIKFISKGDTQPQQKVSKISSAQTKQLNINDLLRMVSDQNLDKNALFGLVRYFTANLTIPLKVENKIPKEANAYFSFILLVCSHKNVDAKLISYLDTETKKKNPTYVIQIEESENQGIKNRKNRKN